MKNPLNPTMARFVLDARSELGYYNSYSKIVALLFLKYVMENSEKIGISIDSSFKKIVDFRNKIDKVIAGTYELSFDDYENFLQILDNQLATPFCSTFLFCDFYKYYFDMFQKKGSDRRVYKSLMIVELPSTPKEWEETLKFIFDESGTDMFKTQENASSDSLTKISASLLKVESNESYLDPFCGFSTSLLNIKKPDEYIGFDIVHENILISFATALFLGVDSNKTNINYEDFMQADDVVVDKIFAEPPLAIKNVDLPKKYEKITKDFGVASLLKINDSLKDGGIAVIATTAKTLFASQKGYEHFRKVVGESGLKAVITLPSLWGRSVVDTNLIVIQKGYIGNVEFISAKETFAKEKGKFIATDEMIEKINDAIAKQTSDEGFSVSVDRRDVICRGNWTPTIYLTPTIKVQETRSVNEIDLELNELYSQFFNNK